MGSPRKRVVASAIALSVVAVFVTAIPAYAVAPTLTGASPASGPPGTPVTLTGTNFNTPNVTSVKFNNNITAAFTIVNGTTITTSVPCGATTGNITVTNADGNATTAFTVSAAGVPTVTSFTPTGGTAGVTSVAITGTNLCGATSVRFNATSQTTLTVNSPTQVTATVPAGATTGKVSVTTPLGTGTSTADFVIGLPTITSFSPTIGLAGTTVTITGTNLIGVNAVKFNGLSATFTVVSSTSISTTVPTGATTGPISVSNVNGTATGATFTVGVPIHPRSVSFSYKGNRASGNVGVGDGFNACRAFVPVYIQQLRNGNWRLLDTTATNASGAYSTWVPDKIGKFRAQVKKLELADGSTCKADASPTRLHS